MATNTNNSAIVGAWGFAYGVITFLPNGTYFHAEVNHDQGDAYDNAHTPSGMEYGTYSWDSATGKFSSETLVDTNGLAGLSDPTAAQKANPPKVSVVGDKLTTRGDFSVTRITSSTNPIVGSWDVTYEKPNEAIYTFLADGTYFLAETTTSSTPDDHSGMERGTYSWNPTNGNLSAITLVDTDGVIGGFSDEIFPKHVTISGDKLIVDGFGAATRVGGQAINESPVVEPTHVNHLPTGNVTISGAAKQAETLTATNTLADEEGLGAINYQWLSNNIVISGETKNSHTLTAADVGKTISVKASYIDTFGTAESVNSSLTTAVEKLVIVAPKLVISTKPTNGNDVLTGAARNEKLSGLAGDDTIVGGLGRDTLTGGAGADVFKYNDVKETGATAISRDFITDFNHNEGDKIDLSGIDADMLKTGDQAFLKLDIGAKFSGKFTATGQLFFDTTSHILWGNINADSKPEFSIQLNGVSSLVVEDFVL